MKKPRFVTGLCLKEIYDLGSFWDVNGKMINVKVGRSHILPAHYHKHYITEDGKVTIEIKRRVHAAKSTKIY
jgi:hypothetical protein